MLLLLGVVGFAALVRRNRYSIPAAFTALVVGAYFTATTDNGLSRNLTFPWWRQAERMMYVLALLCAVGVGALAGIAVTYGGRWLRAREVRFARYAEATGISIAAVLGFVVLFSDEVHAGRSMVQRAYEFYSPVSDDSLDGFKVARELAGDDGSVVTDFNYDGSMWMYAFERVEPLHGIALADPGVDPTWSERNALSGSVAQLGSSDEIDALARKYRARAVYFDEKTYADSVHNWTLEMLRATPALDEVFHRGTVTVFAIDVPAER
jgi:hypothetical protein